MTLDSLLDRWAEWVLFLPAGIALKSRYPLIRVMAVPLVIVWMPVFFCAGIVFIFLILAYSFNLAWKGDL